MEDICMQVGKQIRTLRMKKGLTQEALAFRSGLDHSQLGHIEQGKANLTLKTIEKLGLGLEVSMAELMKGVQFDRAQSRPRLPPASTALGQAMRRKKPSPGVAKDRKIPPH